MEQDQWRDRVDVVDVIMRERLAREISDVEGEAACFHPDATIQVSWFKGSVREFTESGRAAADARAKGIEPTPVHLDSMSPPAVTIRGNRATANTACAVRTFATLDGADVAVTAYTRLLWRVERRKQAWLIAGMHGLYIRDMLVPCNPNRVPHLDEEKLASYRPSYRYLSYLFAAQGQPVGNDVPGTDRPETVRALYAADQEWLEQ